MVAAQAAGRRIETADAWIAATALLYDAPLATHNGSDYLGVPGKLRYESRLRALARGQREHPTGPAPSSSKRAVP